jgi:tRNA(Arg) A34 adenosine deaminase TadA
MMNRDQRAINLALKVAKTSNHKKAKHGAVLTKGGSILNLATNSYNYCSFASRFKREEWQTCLEHAEISCIKGLDRAVTKGATIYVARINKAGESDLSKPCSLCQDVLKYVGVKKAVYTVNGEEIGSMKI